MKTMFILVTVFFISSSCIFAQNKAGIKDTAIHINLYVCPTHPGIVTDKSGNCPICGMELHLSQKEILKTQVTKAYVCPIHADVVSDKPGKCPKCGTQLNLSLKEKMKGEMAGLYTCRMHPDVTSDKPGKCPKCGMALVKQ
jgi:uncharacterized paraquat-inducible protein A